MPSRRADVVRLSSPADLICACAQLLGFVPTRSVVVVCLHERRGRVGLAMRFDLPDAILRKPFAKAVEARVRIEAADAVFVVVFDDRAPSVGALPHSALVDALVGRLGDAVVEALFATFDRWWSYRCTQPCCGGSEGTLINRETPGATAVAAAYAFAGQGVLPDRESVVRSVALDWPAVDVVAMRRLIASFTTRYDGISESARRAVVGVLADRLASRLVDPRSTISDEDAAEFAALCDDVVVRDEVLIRGADADSRKRLLAVLREVVRRVPPPFDAAVCAMLAWLAYASGDGVVANVAVDRSLSTDPDYPLALLIVDSLARQVPPWVLEEVMRGAAGDLKDRSEAG